MNIRSIASAKPVPHARKRLTAQEAVQHAAAMVPRLAERAAEAERIRRIPQATIDELHETGLMRLMQPARFGGSVVTRERRVSVMLRDELVGGGEPRSALPAVGRSGAYDSAARATAAPRHFMVPGARAGSGQAHRHPPG